MSCVSARSECRQARVSARETRTFVGLGSLRQQGNCLFGVTPQKMEICSLLLQVDRPFGVRAQIYTTN